MRPRCKSLPVLLIVTTLIAVFLFSLSAPMSLLAQDATSTAPSEPPTTVEATAETLTPTVTATPTETPTPTPTYTELQARLAIARSYLAAGDFATAKEMFAAIVLDDRGDAEALAGLDAAVTGSIAATGTARAPQPTPVPTPTPAPTPAPTFGATFSENLIAVAGKALPGLLVILLVYVLATGARWLLYRAREFCLVRCLPWLGYPSISPGYVLGAFSNALPKDVLPEGDKLVAQVMAERLLAWNELVRVTEIPVEQAPALQLGAMEWVQVLWRWVLPPPRGHRLDGTLLQSGPGVYELHLQQTDLASNAVDRSHAFQSQGLSPAAAFRSLAAEASKWLLSPADIEQDSSIQRPLVVPKGEGARKKPSASELMDEATEQLLPLRRQVELGAIDFPDARRRLAAAESLLPGLPNGSAFRTGLEAAIRDLRRSVPAA